MQRPIATAAASIAALLLGACAGTEASTRQADEVREVEEAGGAEGEEYRISVEIPLDALRFEEDGILKVDELLAERTEFDPADFRLDEVVLVARSDAADAATAELLVLEWRSGAVEVPRGGEQDWYEVRLPAPEEELGGAWLLDVHGATTVDFLVAVLAPRPAVVAERRAERVRTVHRTVDRTRYAIGTYWIYDPTRYYVYHYHDSFWPYRYFTGVWDFRYYDLRFRPRIHRFGHYRGPIHGGGWRDGYRRGWRDSRRAQERRARADAPRRPLSGWRDRRASAHLAALRRNHPRYGSARPDERSRPGHAPRDRRGRRTDEARQRFEELTRASSRRSAPRRAGTADAQTRAAPAEAAAASGRDAPRSFHRPARSRPASRQAAAAQPARTAPRHFERRRSPTARAQQSRHAAGGGAVSNPPRTANPRRAFQAPRRADGGQAPAASAERRSRPAAARTAPPSVRAGTYERRSSAPRAAQPQVQRRAATVSRSAGGSAERRSRPAAVRAAPPSVRAEAHGRRSSAPRAAQPQAQRRAAASRPAEGSAARRSARHVRQSAPQRRSEPAPGRSREAAPKRSGEASAQARPQARRTRSRGFERRPRP